jgi:hypothetical protein
MVESSKEGCPAKLERRRELAKAPDLIYANCQHPHIRKSQQSSAPG